jgi:P-type Ca2+ transporter type 2C
MIEEREWHASSIEETFESLKSDPKGITHSEADRRQEEFGPNEFKRGQETTWFDLLLHQLINPLVAVLILAAIVAFLAGEIIDTIVIAVVIMINTAIGFFQEYQAENAIEALRSRAAPKAEVLRVDAQGKSQEFQIDTADVVPGDVILVDSGDRVSADARLFEAANLEVNEAMLTGESLPVSKNTGLLESDLSVADRTNLIYSGTIVTEGRGKAVVFAIGQNTQMGEIATLIQETEKAESPLQIQTLTLSKTLSLLAVGAGLAVLLMGYLRGVELEDLFLFAIATVVSVIPEGLPAVMTVTLAVGVNRMAKRNAIIRKLPAVDTLGATTVICSDKTGTLTTNQMTVREIYVSDREIHVTGGGYVPEGNFEVNEQNIQVEEDESLKQALRIGSLCNDSRLAREEGKNDTQNWLIRGDPTEGALIVAARKAGIEKGLLEKEMPRIDEIPFSSDRKYMVTFHDHPKGEVAVYMKGAPETILKYCAKTLEDGEEVKLDQARLEKIHQVNEEMGGRALRVLGTAYQVVEKQDIVSVKDRFEEAQVDMIFAGLMGMLDPARPEAAEAIERCQNAGIKVLMVTGDQRITAEAIARNVGVLKDGDNVYNGSDVEDMSEENLDEVIMQTSVFARVSPAHKQRIVASLQRQGQVVAMTGDGVNDAPALKAAEIGVAMGITGTDVTKETAEMVLTDDNFASIVNAVEEGRIVFQNVRKVVKFLISTNAGEILTILGAIWLLPIGQLIFTPVQILWVNLVTDGILDITIALEPKEGDVMNEEPRHPQTRIISRDMMVNVLVVAVVMAVGTLWVYLNTVDDGDIARAQTMAFITIAMFQVFNAFNVRSQTQSIFKIGLFSNTYLILAQVTSVILLILATTLPFMQTALSTVNLSINDWVTIVLITSTILIVSEVRKLIQRRVSASKAAA